MLSQQHLQSRDFAQLYRTLHEKLTGARNMHLAPSSLDSASHTPTDDAWASVAE